MLEDERRSNYGHLFAWEGEPLAHGLPLPRDWSLTEWGRPKWIAETRNGYFGIWAAIIPPADIAAPRWATPELQSLLRLGPAAMPSLRPVLRHLRVREEHHRGRGRPPLTDTKPDRCRAAAWLRDVREQSQDLIARNIDRDLAAAVYGTSGERTPYQKRKAIEEQTRDQKRKAMRYVQAGRELLARDGVIPWVLWPRGELTTAWWASRLFHQGLRFWYQAIVGPIVASRIAERYDDESRERLQEELTAAWERIRQGFTEKGSPAAVTLLAVGPPPRRQ